MASRRSRSTSVAAEQFIGTAHQDLSSVGPRQYRLLFERAPLPYIVTDFDGTIREANRAAAVLLKRPSELLEGKPLVAFVPLECRADFCEMLAGLPLHDGLRDWRMTLLPYAGAPVDVALHATVLDGAWNGRDAIFWIARPRRRRPPD
jgi:PAS domain-containing protein